VESVFDWKQIEIKEKEELIVTMKNYYSAM
jgi:hypothetical protein